MSSPTPAHCPHERRPGTTVCLHCRHEEREAARARRRQIAGKIGTAAMGLTVLAIAGVAGATALRNQQGQMPASDAAPSKTEAPGTRASAPNAPAAAPRTLNQRTPVAQQGAIAPVTRDSATASSVAPLAPIVAEGRTELPEGMYALRAGANLEVHFDTPPWRTRRADKFEHIVRTTLPILYGKGIDSLLTRTPAGGIATASELLTTLPAKGVKLAIGSGWSLELHPETRPGQDGPLVVTYRAFVTR